jgi:hypothetical protein
MEIIKITIGSASLEKLEQFIKSKNWKMENDFTKKTRAHRAENLTT